MGRIRQMIATMAGRGEICFTNFLLLITQCRERTGPVFRSERRECSEVWAELSRKSRRTGHFKLAKDNRTGHFNLLRTYEPGRVGQALLEDVQDFATLEPFNIEQVLSNNPGVMIYLDKLSIAG